MWYPLNYLVCSALERYGRFFGEDVTLEFPTGSGNRLPLDQIAENLRGRLISLFLVGPDGRRPCFGPYDKMQTDSRWKDHLLYNEYFHGDTGEGLGATHQTGWTGLVADQIRRHPNAGARAVIDLLGRAAQG